MLPLSRFLTSGRVLALVAGSLCVLTPTLQAANNASDTAGNAPYNDGWQTGDNGGTGFGAWSLSADSNSGLFIAQNTNSNGGGGGPGITNPAFGMYADSGQISNAVRSFTGGGLGVGQTFNIAMDNGYANGGASFGFQLLTANDNQTNPNAVRFQYLFFGGQGNYRVNGETGGSEQRTAVGFTDGGMSTSFTLTGADSFSFTVHFNANNTDETFTGTLGGNAGDTIDGVRLFDYNTGTGGQNDLFFNSLSVTGTPVPETSTAVGGLCVVLIFGGTLLRRRGPAQA